MCSTEKTKTNCKTSEFWPSAGDIKETSINEVRKSALISSKSNNKATHDSF